MCVWRAVVFETRYFHFHRRIVHNGHSRVLDHHFVVRHSRYYDTNVMVFFFKYHSQSFRSIEISFALDRTNVFLYRIVRNKGDVTSACSKPKYPVHAYIHTCVSRHSTHLYKRCSNAERERERDG